ncbi:recombinase family protein (plasmid) [Ensifer adhaerens]|uniref:recombinase family protein n=1 Tax=Ensifer adhaerens TaxID=106592 RepID=UPI001CBE4CCA|nr:recombinase family protein [Ensifer adhaerens]MBZ7927059.1 recombinase family protein [Ensifer adhaerens]UAX98109.1 recombinase family protein [Ensifer adhaerens]UAY05490.1 recombinase family protein [Ensifer adhaerens]UAY12868.1 recombinase family protein [Ensifer adhaerens]
MIKTTNIEPVFQPQRIIGYARVSAGEETNDTQLDELRLAGCGRIYQEHRADASRSMPVLSTLLKDLIHGDVLVVASLDRLARSLADLLGVLEDLKDRGIHFRSLADPIDTSTEQGMFALQVLGSIARMERTLASERTKSGMNAAKARGRRAGNPGLRERRPEALRAVSAARERAYLNELVASAQTWLPTVKRLRPDHSWQDIVRILTRRGHSWTVERLRRAVHRMVREKLADPELLKRSPRRPPEHDLMRLVACVAIADPSLSLRDIAAQLDEMQEPPPGGGRKWQSSAVRDLLDEARRFGLIRS